MDEIVKKLDCLYQAAKDRQKACEGMASESYYRGQVVAYGRAVKAASQPAVQADAQKPCDVCKHPAEAEGGFGDYCRYCGRYLRTA